MTTRHAEIRVWSSYRDELTSWLCLLDDRFADELQEAEQSAVPVEQGKLDVGKAARSSKLWFLLKQSMSKFQRAQDLIRLIEIQQRGASAGYEFSPFVGLITVLKAAHSMPTTMLCLVFQAVAGLHCCCKCFRANHGLVSCRSKE